MVPVDLLEQLEEGGGLGFGDREGIHALEERRPTRNDRRVPRPAHHVPSLVAKEESYIVESIVQPNRQAGHSLSQGGGLVLRRVHLVDPDICWHGGGLCARGSFEGELGNGEEEGDRAGSRRREELFVRGGGEVTRD